MNYLIWVSFLSLFVLGFADNMRGPIFPEVIKTFQLSDAQASWYFALSSFTAFLFSFAVRKVNSVRGLLHVLYAGVFTIFLGYFLQYLATSYWFVLIGVVFIGASMGLLGVAQNNLVMLGTNEKNRSQMLSFLHSMYGVASLIAPLYVASLSHFSWQVMLNYVGWVAFAFVVIGYLINFKLDSKLSAYDHAHASSAEHISGPKDLIISIVISLYVLTEIMVGTRLALYMRRYYDYDLRSSSIYVTLFFVFLLLGRLIVSFKPPAIALRTQLQWSLLGSIVLVLVGAFVHPLGFVLSGFTMAPFYPLSIAYISKLAPKSSSAIVSWTVAIQSFCIVIMHWGVGKLTDVFELKWALLAGPVCLLFAFLFLNLTKETA